MPKGEASSVRKATSIFRGKKKERSQPSQRAKLGLLEKHKDYVERARNFHAKEKRIAALQASSLKYQTPLSIIMWYLFQNRPLQMWPLEDAIGLLFKVCAAGLGRFRMGTTGVWCSLASEHNGGEARTASRRRCTLQYTARSPASRT